MTLAFLDDRQKTGTVRLAGIVMLCMSTSILGFSRQNDTAVATEPVAPAESEWIIHKTLAESVFGPATRPSSYVSAAYVNENSVLGGVNSVLWFETESAPDDRSVKPGAEPTGVFHGVGFPDIRTYQKKSRRYNALNPHPWAPMISWRKRNDDQSAYEPIAHVRCMGLSPQAVARRADRYIRLITDYSSKFDVSVSLIKAVIKEESCFNSKALSPVGAQGLMQLMPKTATWLKVRDPHDPADNLRGGIRYLAALREQFETLELALAAYNAGPGNVRRYGGVPPFAETRDYVRKVKASYRRYAAATLVASR